MRRVYAATSRRPGPAADRSSTARDRRAAVPRANATSPLRCSTIARPLSRSPKGRPMLHARRTIALAVAAIVCTSAHGQQTVQAADLHLRRRRRDTHDVDPGYACRRRRHDGRHGDARRHGHGAAEGTLARLAFHASRFRCAGSAAPDSAGHEHGPRTAAPRTTAGTAWRAVRRGEAAGEAQGADARLLGLRRHHPAGAAARRRHREDDAAAVRAGAREPFAAGPLERDPQRAVPLAERAGAEAGAGQCLAARRPAGARQR